MWTITIAILVIALTLLLGYNKWRHSYWSSRGIKGPKPYPLFGNLLALILGERWTYVNNVYKEYKTEKIYGCYTGLEPNIGVCDPELIRQITIKDFNHFDHRRIFSVSGKDKWISEMLTAKKGMEWKTLRATLSPMFSSGKLKQMFNIVCRQGDNLVKYCQNLNNKGKDINAKDAFGRFTMDVIASVAFGIESNSLINEDAIFPKKADQIFKTSFIRIIRTMLFFIFPMKFLQFLGFRVLDDTWEFFKSVSTETINERRKTKEKRGDLLDILLEEQEKQNESFDSETAYKITDSTILAQSVLFIIAGYDTTANTLSFTSHFLAKHLDEQEKLRQEIQQIVDSEGNIDYHGIMEAKYLDACISESLRLVSPAFMTERTCSADYTIPGTNVIVTKDMSVQIPIWGLHHDPEYWPQPEVFRPERFLPENKADIVPFSYMPFGMGPRNCIAMRFALMEAKTAIAKLLLNYKITLAPGDEKLEFDRAPGIIRPKSGVTLRLQKL